MVQLLGLFMEHKKSTQQFQLSILENGCSLIARIGRYIDLMRN